MLLTLENKNENKDTALQCTYNINFMICFLSKLFFLSENKLASGVGCAPVCLRRLNESYSRNLRWLKGFYHSQSLKEPYAQSGAQLSPGFLADLLSGIMIFVGYFRVANAFPFSLHSPPSLCVDCCRICTTPFIFTFKMPKRENARKVKPCWNTCVRVSRVGKSAEPNTPIFYTAAFAPHPHTITYTDE